MRVELKAIKYFPSLSEETNCFQATIYIDGKKVGTCENRGTGGSTDYRISDPALRTAFETYAKSLPAKTAQIGDQQSGGHLTYPMSAEALLDDLLIEHLDAKEESRLAKKAQSEKKRHVAAGFPVTIEIRDAAGVMWLGLKNQDQISAAFESRKAKYKMGPDAVWKEVR